MGDRLGGSGWEVEMPDGTIEHLYVELPAEIGKSWLELKNAPTEHDDSSIPDASIDTLGTLYLDALSDLMNDAFK